MASELLDLDRVRIDAGLALRVPPALALRRRLIAFGEDEAGVQLACEDPADWGAIEAVERVLGRSVTALRAEPASLERALARVFAARAPGRGDDATGLVDEILHAALLEQASDVHVEPDAEGVAIRLRVDGALEPHRRLSAEQSSGLVNRLKVLGGMDIAERRVPQDGRFTHQLGRGEGARAVDVRAAVLPTRFGERVTLRLLAAQGERLTLATLGLDDAALATLAGVLRAPHGLVLLTGPTGSGKTTTLYAALRTIDLVRRNVLTVEDPVEYDLPGISQIEVDSADRISFARALRSLLRHDPDVLMIGEIRDAETAEVAVRAALTGHLVLSTLHTSTAVGAVTRLVDVGVAPYLVAATLRLVVAQRLVRRLCLRCRRPRPADEAEARALGLAPGATVWDAPGCAACKRSGHAGRVGGFEVRAFAPAARRLVAEGAGEQALLEQAFARGRALREDLADKVRAGVTSPAEALLAVEAS